MKRSHAAASLQFVLQQYSRVGIPDTIKEMVARVEDMINGSKRIEHSVQSITAAIEGIVSVSKENIDSAEQISAGTQAQNAAIEELVGICSKQRKGLP